MARKSGPICISVINMKGGVGKTTIAALLARYASLTLKRTVLAIDLDPQANLSQAVMGEHRYRQFINDGSPSIVEIFNGYNPPTSTRASSSPLDIDDVVVGHTSWGGANLQIIPSRFDFSDKLISSIGTTPRVLAKLIANNFQDKDLIIIDCAPTESIFTQVAYHASRYILVPVKPEYFATIGFPLLNESLTAFRRKNRSHLIDVIGVVINNPWYDSGNGGGPEIQRAMKEIKREARKNKWHIFKKELPHSRGFPRMMRGGFSNLRNAERYIHFAGEFFRRLGLEEE